MNKVYRVKRNGMYLVETEEFGVYRTSNNKNDAMEFTSLIELEKYVEYELRLNISNVSIEQTEYIEQTTTIKSHNGVFYNIETHFVCNNCGNIQKLVNANYVSTINGKEELCNSCYARLDSDEFEDITLDAYNKQ